MKNIELGLKRNESLSALRNQLIANLVEITKDLPMPEIAALVAHATHSFECASTCRNPIADGSGLTVREQEVLVLVAHGYSRRAIGQSLSISMNTAARHIANIYSKLGVSTVAEATVWAYSQQLISLPEQPQRRSEDDAHQYFEKLV